MICSIILFYKTPLVIRDQLDNTQSREVGAQGEAHVHSSDPFGISINPFRYCFYTTIRLVYSRNRRVGTWLNDYINVHPQNECQVAMLQSRKF